MIFDVHGVVIDMVDTMEEQSRINSIAANLKGQLLGGSAKLHGIPNVLTPFSGNIMLERHIEFNRAFKERRQVAKKAMKRILKWGALENVYLDNRGTLFALVVHLVNFSMRFQLDR